MSGRHAWNLIHFSSSTNYAQVFADKLVVDEHSYIFFNEDRKDQPLVVPIANLIAVPIDTGVPSIESVGN